MSGDRDRARRAGADAALRARAEQSVTLPIRVVAPRQPCR